MAAMGLRADVLGWEFDRQQSLASNAGPDESRSYLQLVDAPPLPAWHDKLEALPAICSALIPLREGEEEHWSKPFSLVKADFEPWLSYYAGYCMSRLFLDGGSTVSRRLDYPIQALLSLRGIDPRIVLEPPVRIDGPVKYFDPSHAPGAARGPARADSLARAAEAMHRTQLKRAGERGKELGDRLHEALLGEGLDNLIRAWVRVHARKPTPHELHLMLTTGRVTPMPPEASPSFASTEPASAPVRSERSAPAPVQPASLRPSVVAAGNAAVLAAAVQGADAAEDADMEPDWVTLSSQKQKGAPTRSPYWYVFHIAGLTGAALLAYLLLLPA